MERNASLGLPFEPPRRLRALPEVEATPALRRRPELEERHPESWARIADSNGSGLSLAKVGRFGSAMIK